MKAHLHDALQYQAEEWIDKSYLRLRLFGFALLFCVLYVGVGTMLWIVDGPDWLLVRHE